MAFMVTADSSKASTSQVASWGPHDDPSNPPYALMEHAPLAIFTNGMLAAFNELRHCAPLSIAPAIANLLQVRYTMQCVYQILAYCTLVPPEVVSIGCLAELRCCATLTHPSFSKGIAVKVYHITCYYS